MVRYPFDSVISFVNHRFKNRDPKKIKILDFGCGPGNHLVYLVENKFDAFGVDVSATAVDLARAALGIIDSDFDGEHVTVIDGNALPFANNMFDAVIDRSALGQNRADEIPLIVKEIERVLKPGGAFFGINFSDLHPDIMLGKPLGNGDHAFFEAGRFNNNGSRHFFSVDEVRSLFANFQLDDIRILEDRSLFDRGANVQIAIYATKHHV